jgi:hypothetical protein
MPVPTLKVVTEEDKKYWKIGEEVKNRFKLRQANEEK